MFRRSLALLGVALLAASIAPTALGVSVHVRVEGKTQTIFGATQPTLELGGGLPAPTVLRALYVASIRGEFYFHVRETGFGPYVDQIGLYPASVSNGWTFKVDGVVPQVGAGEVVLTQGSTVLWYWATFGPTGGPPTLELVRSGKRCFRVLARDDAGKRTVAAGAALAVDGRTVPTRGGRACLRGRHGLVRATRPGSVRSNALR